MMAAFPGDGETVEASAASSSTPKGFALWTPGREHGWRDKPTLFRVKLVMTPGELSGK